MNKAQQPKSLFDRSRKLNGHYPCNNLMFREKAFPTHLSAPKLCGRDSSIRTRMTQECHDGDGLLSTWVIFKKIVCREDQ